MHIFNIFTLIMENVQNVFLIKNHIVYEKQNYNRILKANNYLAYYINIKKTDFHGNMITELLYYRSFMKRKIRK